MAEPKSMPETAKKRTTTAKADTPAAPKKAAAPRKAAAKKGVYVPGAEERYRMIQVAAYYVAERHGFLGDPKEFWAQAEAQIEQMLSR